MSSINWTQNGKARKMKHLRGLSNNRSPFMKPRPLINPLDHGYDDLGIEIYMRVLQYVSSHKNDKWCNKMKNTDEQVKHFYSKEYKRGYTLYSRTVRCKLPKMLL